MRRLACSTSKGSLFIALLALLAVPRHGWAQG